MQTSQRVRLGVFLFALLGLRRIRGRADPLRHHHRHGHRQHGRRAARRRRGRDQPGHQRDHRAADVAMPASSPRPTCRPGRTPSRSRSPASRTFKQTSIPVETAQTVRIAVEMKISTVGEVVEVGASTGLIQTDSCSVEGAMNAKMIESLPNITQNPLQYAMLQAGAVGRPATQDTTSVNSFGIGVDGRRQWSAVGVNGGRAFTNDIQLDGLPVMGGGYNEASVVPNTEGLQEVRVISNNFTAEYGRGQAVISMSTKSGTNRFTGQAAYMGRHEAPRRQHVPNNAQRIAKRPFRVSDLGGAIGGPILKNKLFFFTSYHQLRHNNTSTMLQTVPTALERLGDFSQTLVPERERPAGAGAHLRSVQRRAARPGSLPARRDPERADPEPEPGGAADVQLLPAAEPHPGRRLQHQQLRGVDRPDDPPLQLEQPRRLPHRPALDLRQRRHLLRRDHHAAPVRRVAVQRRRRHPRRRQPVRPDRRRGRARADAAARRPLRRQPHQHQEPERRQDRVRRLRLVRRAGEPAAVHPVPRRGAQRQPERLHRRRGRRRRQQLERADHRQLQHQARVPDQPQRRGERHQDARRLDPQGRLRVPQPALELRRSRAGLGGAAVAVRAGRRQLQLRVRDRQRRRRVSRPAPTRSAASTRPGRCSAPASGGSARAPTSRRRSRRSTSRSTRRTTGARARS